MDILVNTPGASPALLQKEMEVPEHIKNMTFSTDSLPSLDGSGSTITTDKGIELKETPPIKSTEDLVKEEEALWKNDEVLPPKEKVAEKVEAPKTEQVKPVDKPKVEDKGALKPKDNKIQQISPVKAKAKEDTTQDTFDYSKYSAQEVTNMKNMSRQSREAYAKVLEENKQLATYKDANYLQHENGYTLTPEYRDLCSREGATLSEGKAWEQALLAIKGGKEFREPVDIDPKTGQLIYSQPRKATDADEIRIQQNLQLCTTELGKVRGELNGYGNKFQSRIKEDIQGIQAERKNRFAWVEDPKLLDANVEINGQEIPVKGVIEHFKSLLPAYHRNSIIADVAADLFVALQIQSSQLREAQNGKAVAEVKVKETSRAEPTSDASDRGTSDTIKVAGGRTIPKTFSLEGMPS